MYRLKIYVTEKDAATIRVKCDRKQYSKNKVVLSDCMKACAHADKLQSARAYGMYRALREVMRDLLYIDFGDRWRHAEHENYKYIEKSIFSAVKRMKVAPL